jgi:hypothetical protein
MPAPEPPEEARGMLAVGVSLVAGAGPDGGADRVAAETAEQVEPTTAEQMAPEEAEPPLPDHPAWPGDRLGGLYATVFPTTMLNFYPWGISMNLIEPVGVDRCRILYRYYVTDPALRTVGAGGDLDTVEAEDQAVVDRVGRGMRSRFAGPSRFAPGHEDAVAGYHAELARLLGL